MKRISKIFINLISVVLLLVCSLSFSACEEIKVLEFKVEVFDINENQMVEETLSIDLYRHLAPKTVDAIIDYAKNGYYDNTLFYIDTTRANSQIMFGDLKFDEGSENLVSNFKDTTLKGEFASNGTTGSDLINAEGYIGLWRSWINGFTKSETARDSGRATLYMPTQSLSTYDGFFCVFGKFDRTSDAWTKVKAVLNNAVYYENYTIYYTGEDVSDLTFNSVKSSEFTLQDGEYYKAEEGEIKAFDKCTVKVPLYDKGNGYSVSAYIKSASVK